jgi:hypothetical protein
MGIGYLIVLLAVLTLTGSVAAQKATPMPLPEGVAPLGLGNVRLTEDVDDIAVLFAAMPSVIAGYQKCVDPRLEDWDIPTFVAVCYADPDPRGGFPLILIAEDVTGPRPRERYRDGAEYVGALALRPPLPSYQYVEVTGAGQDGALVWFEFVFSRDGDRFVPGATSPSPAGSGVGISFAWQGSPWAFEVIGPTVEARNALVTALVSIAPPTPAGTPVGRVHGRVGWSVNPHLPAADPSAPRSRPPSRPLRQSG